MVVLELNIADQAALKLIRDSACLCLPNIEIKGVCALPFQA